MTIHGQFLVRPNIEQSTGGIIAASRKRKTIREKRHSIDIRLVSGERLLTNTLPDVPQFCGGITRPRHKRSHVVRQTQWHHVTGVAQERGHLLAGLNVPEGAAHVTRTGHDLIVVEETTTGQVTSVTGQFAAHTDIAFTCLQAVYWTDVI